MMGSYCPKHVDNKINIHGKELCVKLVIYKKKLLYSILATILHSDERYAADEVTAAVVQGISLEYDI